MAIELSSLKLFAPYAEAVKAIAGVGTLVVAGIFAWAHLESKVSALGDGQDAIQRQIAATAVDHDQIVRHTQQLEDLKSDVSDMKQDIKTLVHQQKK